MQFGRWLCPAYVTLYSLADGYLLLTQRHGVWQTVTYCFCDTMQFGRWLCPAYVTLYSLVDGYLLLTQHHGVWQMATYCFCDTTESGRWLPIAYELCSLADGYLLLSRQYIIWQMVTCCCYLQDQVHEHSVESPGQEGTAKPPYNVTVSSLQFVVVCERLQ